MHAEVTTVFKKHHRTIQQISPDTATPLHIRESAELNSHYYASIVTDDYEDGVYIDLSTMMQEQLIGQTYTWDEFYNTLTPALVDSYKIVNIGSNSTTTKKTRVLHPLTAVGIDIQYCDKRDTTQFDLYYKRWDLPDLAISIKEKYKNDFHYINLQNCIVSINGVVCFSTFFEDKLYVSEGSKNLWNINRFTTPDITVLDVSEIGDLVALPLSKCKIIYNGQGEEIYDNIIKIQLPEGYDFDTYTPILSIAGKCMFADELSIPNINTIFLHPNRIGLQNRLLALYDNQSNYMNNTEIVHTVDTTIMQYLSQLGKTDRSDIYDVLYLVKTPTMNITREYLTKDILWLTKLNYHDSGLAVRTSDHAWMDYTSIEYEQYNLRHGVVYPTNLMRMTVEDNIHSQYGVREIRCNHLDEHFRWTRDAAYQMLYITA